MCVRGMEGKIGGVEVVCTCLWESRFEVCEG